MHSVDDGAMNHLAQDVEDDLDVFAAILSWTDTVSLVLTLILLASFWWWLR